MTWREMWTDELPEAWKTTVDGAASFAALTEAVEADWLEIMPDVLAELHASTESDWAAFRDGLAIERQKEFAGAKRAERWGHTLLPDVLIRLFEIVPAHASMPARVAVDRLVALKQLVKRDDAYWIPA